MKPASLLGLWLIVGCGSVGGVERLAPPTTVTRNMVRVEAVADGDSFRADTGEIRLVGVNAPERDECFGTESRDWLMKLLEGKDVEINPIGRDQFDRHLAEVFLDGVSVNLEMVRTGQAIALSGYPPFLRAEAEAREGELGLWGGDICGAARERTNLAIDEIDYNPPGDDEFELVVIGNHSQVPVDLDGFVLRDESSVHRFKFPAIVLEPGAFVEVTTGCAQGGDPVGWCTGEPVWNNGGDAVIVLDAYGRVVAFRRY